MQIGMMGLGRMGGNMARRLLRAGHGVIGYNRTYEVARALADEEGLQAAHSVEEMVDRLSAPRAVWLMLPAGEPTEDAFRRLGECMDAGDLLVDGGNSNYKMTIERGLRLAKQGIELVDVGTSGGVWGLTHGYCLMVGGAAAAVERLRPVLQALAPSSDTGWGHVGPTGAGHFVKMIHNGIEYGLMQAYAEGFEILRAKESLDLDLYQVAEIWKHGSVIRSWLLELIAETLEADASLADVRAWVADSGEGRWATFEAVDLDVPAPVMTLALQARLASRQEESYAAKLLASMRHRFGGHEIRRAEPR